MLLIYTYYRAEVQLHGLQFERYFKYYVISIFAILFWGVVLWLNEEIRFKILTVTISLLIGLYITEGVLLKIFKVNRATVATKLGIEFDQRTRLEVIKDLKAEGVEAVPPVIPQYLIDKGGIHQDGTILFPLGGISKKTTVGKNEGGKYSIYKSDRYGFNNPDSEWDSSNIKWLMVGDSFARGSSVQEGEEIAGQIRYLTNSTVINLGINGNGPLTELATLTEYAKSLRPKKILWAYFENDLNNMHQEKSLPILMQYLEDNFSQNLMDRQKEIDRELKELIAKDTHALLSKTQWLRLYNIRLKIKILTSSNEPKKVNAKIDPLFIKILAKAKKRTEAWGGGLYFVYLPSFSHFNEKKNYDLNRQKKELIELVKGLSIPVIDIQQKVFSDHPDPLSLFPLRINGHYNAKGYSEVAKAIISSVGD